MKTLHRLTLASLLFLAISAIIVFGADAAPKTPPAPSALEKAFTGKSDDPIQILTKERDAAKAELDQVKAQQQQQAIITEYWKAVAEKNQAILQIIALQQQLTEAKAETEKVKAELEALKKPAPTPEAKK